MVRMRCGATSSQQLYIYEYILEPFDQVSGCRVDFEGFGIQGIHQDDDSLGVGYMLAIQVMARISEVLIVTNDPFATLLAKSMQWLPAIVTNDLSNPY